MNVLTKKIALERIRRLFQLATDAISEDESAAQRYIVLARRISMTSKTRIPREYHRQICRRCKSFILPGINCRVRIQQQREPHMVITCSYCGEHMRFPIRNKRRKARA